MQGILIPQFWCISNLQKIMIIKIKNITCYNDLGVLTKLNIANTPKAQGNRQYVYFSCMCLYFTAYGYKKMFPLCYYSCCSLSSGAYWCLLLYPFEHLPLIFPKLFTHKKTRNRRREYLNVLETNPIQIFYLSFSNLIFTSII